MDLCPGRDPSAASVYSKLLSIKVYFFRISIEVYRRGGDKGKYFFSSRHSLKEPGILLSTSIDLKYNNILVMDLMIY